MIVYYISISSTIAPSSLFLNTQEDFLKTFVCAFDGLF